MVGGFMGFVFGLPFGYLFGLPIVLVMWVEDWFLSDKIGLGMKVATFACVGYVASIAMLLLTSALHLQLPQILSFGIVGAIPAAVCSWLAGTTENRGTAPVAANAGDLPPDGAAGSSCSSTARMSTQPSRK